ncbi:MFS transporter [Stutzerimonas kirkiae]|uniref:MFS transporter n=1 Tax=Stutzerimonas kirkiae TaxID=2211392 RepID=A0A4Q9R3T5_9GAMM|nr:MFS transporter [Stutzerimonas kirkiae]TBU94590.1 MFS transporter [Stutzerimonas kirkiae]TBV00725.1 MFS transporter [Stutzerimonas kirkiae]TBV04323.1 MFS transporter [Stutzerimonas kirkiae]TBV12791.1 MFS transporter [Stutzerimonas kirkiae]
MATNRSLAWPLLLAISTAHLFNDMLQALLPMLYPQLREAHGLSYGQLGAVTFVFHLVGSVCQPLVGAWGDRRPRTGLLPLAMLCSGLALSLLAFAQSFSGLLLVAGLLGLGSSLFHPEGSRSARMVSGGRHGLAQSVFQLGGNIGSALAPLLIALLISPLGLGLLGWLPLLAVAGGGLLLWLRPRLAPYRAACPQGGTLADGGRLHTVAMLLLSVLILSKYVYLAAMANYYSFYLIERFGLSAAQAQLQLFVFLAAVAVGTLLGGPLSDRFGQRPVILLSILGSCPFTLLLPQVGLEGAILLSVAIGVTMASAFPIIIVYAQRLMPQRIGLIAGFFFGLTFGISGIAAAVLGLLADWKGIVFLFEACAYLPLLGILALWLPRSEKAVTPGLEGVALGSKP